MTGILSLLGHSGGWRRVSRVVWGQSCLEVSGFVQTSSSVKNGGRPEALSAPPDHPTE